MALQIQYIDRVRTFLWCGRGLKNRREVQFLEMQRIETVLKTVEVPEFQFSGSSSSWTNLLACPLLCTSGVCQDCAETVEVPQLQFIDKGVQTLTSGGYGGLAVFEWVFRFFLFYSIFRTLLRS